MINRTGQVWEFHFKRDVRDVRLVLVTGSGANLSGMHPVLDLIPSLWAGPTAYEKSIFPWEKSATARRIA